MNFVTSKDGTRIAFEKSGQGPALIIVVGAFNDRLTGQPLTQLLEQHFTVFNYDRRGRGDSSDTLPYAVEREIEDLEALIEAAGGSAAVLGYSSGAVLALKAAAAGAAITAMALYEPPLLAQDQPIDADNISQARLSAQGDRIIEVSNQPTFHKDMASQLNELVSAGRRGDAVELFQTKVVGIPPEMTAQFRNAPFWPALEKMAHTLVYEMTIIGDASLPSDVIAAVTAPTLVMAGGASPAFLQNAARWLGDALPKGQHCILQNQTHDIVPSAMAPVVETFFAAHPVSD